VLIIRACSAMTGLRDHGPGHDRGVQAARGRLPPALRDAVSGQLDFQDHELRDSPILRKTLNLRGISPAPALIKIL
jgi:hypothetical protein